MAFAGFIVYIDRPKRMEILCRDGDPVLFNSYEEARNACRCLDVVVPINEAEWKAIKNKRIYFAPRSSRDRDVKIGEPYRFDGPYNPMGASARTMRNRRLQDGYVYLIRAKGLNGTYKIGQAFDPIQRLNNLQSACPVELVLECVILTDNMSEMESMFHRKFDGKRIRGEWFSLTKDDIAFIERFVDIDMEQFND